MIIKFHKKQEEKFPEWKAVVPKNGKMIEVVQKEIADETSRKNFMIMSIEEAANIEDRYFAIYSCFPKELTKYIKSLVDYKL